MDAAPHTFSLVNLGSDSDGMLFSAVESSTVPYLT